MPTLAYLRARVLRELKENENPDLINDKLNDAIENLWEALLMVNVSQFTSGPVSGVQFNQGDERQTIISVPDPLVAPTLASIAGASIMAGRTVYVQYTLVTESGSETKPSPSANIVLADALHVASAIIPQPASVSGLIGWNVYASYDVNGRMARQNALPLELYQSWTEPDNAINQDPDAPSMPLVNSTADDIFAIKELRVQNVDSTWTHWTASELGSLLWQRAERNLPAATTYQSYAWDVIGGNILELRPAAGQALSPNYFYIKKPRRLRFDNAIIPFQNFAAEEFLINFAVGRLKLTNEEYQAATIWKSLADEKKLQFLQAANTQNAYKQQAVTPYFRY